MDKNKIVFRAFQLACKCLREHPPADTCDHIELIQCVVGGVYDPEGKRWMAYFLNQAIQEEKANEREGKESD